MKYLIKSRSGAVTIPLRICTNLCVAAVMLVAVQRAPAQSPASTPHSGLINTAGAAFNAATGKGYIADSASGEIHISNDSDGTVRSVKAGANPTSIAADAANGRAYVVNAGDGAVSVLDGKTDEVIATVPVGAHPYSIAADSAAGKIYVTRTYSDQLMVIDAATNQLSGIKAGSPDLVAVNEKTHTVYLLSYEMGDLAILDGVTHNITRTSVGMHAWGMALNSATGVLYIAKPGDGSIAVLAPGSTTPTFIHTGGIPCAVAINPRTHTIYAADYAGDRIFAISSSTARVVAEIPVGNRPEGIAVDPEHNRVYAANTLSHNITVIDGLTNKVVRTQPTDSAPYAIAVDPVRRKLHVAALGHSSFAVIADEP